MCIELGLHRRDSLFKTVTDEEERASVVKLFWSVYVLDRRWSFGTGLPFAMQDADIDPNLPEPVSCFVLQVYPETNLNIGNWHSIPQCYDCILPHWIKSLALCCFLS
jgi:hypothetical protein